MKPGVQPFKRRSHSATHACQRSLATSSQYILNRFDAAKSLSHMWPHTPLLQRAYLVISLLLRRCKEATYHVLQPCPLLLSLSLCPTVFGTGILALSSLPRPGG